MSKPRGRNGTRHAWIGAAIIAILSLVCGVTFFLDHIAEALRRSTSVVAVIEGVPNLRRGASVWIAGKPAGRLEHLALLPTNDSVPMVAARLHIPRSVRDQLRADASVRITSARRIGEPSIDILPGTPAAPPFPAGDTLTTSSRLSLDDLRIDAATLRTSLDSLRAAAAALAGPASDGMRSYDIVMRHAASARDHFADLSAAARSGAFRIASDTMLGHAVASLRGAATYIQARLQATAPRRRELADATTDMRGRVQRLIATLDAVDLRSENGTIGRFQNDSALAHALDGVRAQLDSLIAEAKANPGRFVF